MEGLTHPKYIHLLRSTPGSSVATAPFTLCVCVSNCSVDSNDIGPEGGAALGEALTVNQTLRELKYVAVTESVSADPGSILAIHVYHVHMCQSCSNSGMSVISHTHPL